jgi:DNA-binding IclR family transcriptional regulator
MAASLLSRALGIFELLAQTPRGVGLQLIADTIDMPKSGVHRILGEMSKLGYVIQDETSGQYRLTHRMADMGIQHLASCGLIDATQPQIDALAAHCQELVRLAIIDRGRPVFMVKAQGATSALKYDPESGGDAPLFCTATAFVWLASFSDDEAIRLIAAQGPIDPSTHGPACPSSFAEVLEHLKATRQRGFGKVINMSSPGMSAITVGITGPSSGKIVAVLSIGGPTARLTEARMEQLLPALQATAKELEANLELVEYLETLALNDAV